MYLHDDAFRKSRLKLLLDCRQVIQYTYTHTHQAEVGAWLNLYSLLLVLSSFIHHSNMPHTTSFCFSWSNHSVATEPLCREDRQMVQALMKCCWILSCFHAAVLRYIIQHEILVISTMHCAKRDANHFCSKSPNCNIYATNELISVNACDKPFLKLYFVCLFCVLIQ